MFWPIVVLGIVFGLLRAVAFSCLGWLLLVRLGASRSIGSIGFITFGLLLIPDILGHLTWPRLQLTVKTSNPFLIRLFGSEDFSDKVGKLGAMDVVGAAILAFGSAAVVLHFAR
jgi:hypothetical protein